MDEAGSWDNVHERFEVKRIYRQEAYPKDSACINWAEEFFSRMCRAEIGIHRHIAGASLLRYAQDRFGERTTAVCRTVSKSTASRIVLETWQVS